MTLVKIKGPDNHDGLFLARSLQIEGVERVMRGSIKFDYDDKWPVFAELEVRLGNIDIIADGTMFTIIDNKRYRLVEEQG